MNVTPFWKQKSLSELSLDEGSGMHMAQVGNEYGTTTGRPRRTGWLDMVALRESNRINGYTGLVVTKLDVLGGLEFFTFRLITGPDLKSLVSLTNKFAPFSAICHLQ